MQYKKGNSFHIIVVGFDAETKRRIQEKLFSLGVLWQTGQKEVLYLDNTRTKYYRVQDDGRLIKCDWSNTPEGESKLVTLEELMAMEPESAEPIPPEGFEHYIVGNQIMLTDDADYEDTTLYKAYTITEANLDEYGDWIVCFRDDAGDLVDVDLSDELSGEQVVPYEKRGPNKRFHVPTGDIPNKMRRQLRNQAEYLGYNNWKQCPTSNYRGLMFSDDGEFWETETNGWDAEALTLKEFFRLEPQDCFE